MLNQHFLTTFILILSVWAGAYADSSATEDPTNRPALTETDPHDPITVLLNPNFAQGLTNWTVEGKSLYNVLADEKLECAEAWDCPDLDIYQISEQMPAGVYEVLVQGAYLKFNNGPAWREYFEIDGTRKEIQPECPTYLYANDCKSALSNVFDYGVLNSDSIYPDGFFVDPIIWRDNDETYNGKYAYPMKRSSFVLAFDRGAYISSVFSVVPVPGETLRIGIKNTSEHSDKTLAIFSHFKVKYHGYDADIIDSMLQLHLQDIDMKHIGESIDFDGQFADTDLYDKADSIRKAVNDVLTSKEAKTKFDVLTQEIAIGAKIQASVSLFALLHDKYQYFIEVCNEVIKYLDEKRNAELIRQSQQFLEELEDGLLANDLTDADAERALSEIDRLSKELISNIPLITDCPVIEQLGDNQTGASYSLSGVRNPANMGSSLHIKNGKVVFEISK